MAIRVLISHRNSLIQTGIQSELIGNDNIQLVGDIKREDDLLQKINEFNPDVIILYCNAYDQQLSDALRLIMEHDLSNKILILSGNMEKESVLKIIKCGVGGYLLVDDTSISIAQAIQVIAEGRTWFSPTISSIIAESLQPRELGKPLTKRELQVLNCLSQGYTNK